MTVQDMLCVVPHQRQLAWQRLEFTAFFHFGINTFTGREWGDGTETPALFCPETMDTDQWCEGIVAAGITACILTAKHHDGFCLWDTAYTGHSVMNSPCKRDLVAELSASCKKHGLKLGLYLSPWDRHESTYGSGTAYNNFFCAQLTELLTNYGELYALWFDGACGEGANGKKQEYDWDRYYSLIRKYQPEAVISVCGPDVRWCGNEAGRCRIAEWSVVPGYLCDNEKVRENSQQEDSTQFRERLESGASDLGGREILEQAETLLWYPAEVDTSIRPGWFYHSEEDERLKTLEELKNIYLQSVGGNSVLLLNIPPNKDGLLAPCDCRRLRELGTFIRGVFSKSVGETSVPCEGTIILKQPEWVRYVVLMEAIEKSQRVESFSLYAKIDGQWEGVYAGQTIGYKKICVLENSVYSMEWKLEIHACRGNPMLQYFGLFCEC